jgi:hypothetical protein
VAQRRRSLRIPIGFRLWRPQRSCAPQRYGIKMELVADIVASVVAARLPAAYIVVECKGRNWSVETIFRDTKSFGGLEASQCWVNQAMVRHVALVLATFVVA